MSRRISTLTEAEETEIIKFYLEPNSATYTAQVFNLSDERSVFSLLKKHNIAKHNDQVLSKMLADRTIHLWASETAQQRESKLAKIKASRWTNKTDLELAEINKKSSETNKLTKGLWDADTKLAFSQKVSAGTRQAMKSIDISSKMAARSEEDILAWKAKLRARSTKYMQQLSEEQKVALYTKISETKKINGSFNTSMPEERSYNYLCELYGKDNVIRQYKDSLRYPFNCDFYILSEDLFIECNYSWTHGGKEYCESDVSCQNKLEHWKIKATKSKFYLNAIKTWTVRDINKFKTAKANGINYKVFYSETDLKAWIKELKCTDTYIK